MPNIIGTNGNDDIDVVNDVGTLNGVGAGSPIVEIRGRRGSDTIDIIGSNITGFVRGGRGSDTVTISNSSVGSIRLGADNDTLNIINTSVGTDLRGGGGDDALNFPQGTVITDTTHGIINVVNGGMYSLSSGTAVLPTGQVISYISFETGTGILCFCDGTLIRTPGGDVAIESLSVGDWVNTLDTGPAQIRWIGAREISATDQRNTPKLCPVRIPSGALGNGLPTRDLRVSPQHRVFLRSRIAQRMFGETEILIPAIKLAGYGGICQEQPDRALRYFHLLFDRHQVIWSNDAPTESLFTGPEALKSMGAAACEEIFTLFPMLRGATLAPDPARHIVQRRKQVGPFLRRHTKNAKPLIAA